MDGNVETGPDWAAIRRDYEANAVILETVAARHKVSVWSIQYRARRDGWTPRLRVPSTDRTRLIGRMMAVLERQIAKLEREAEMKDPAEKEVALLSTMTRTLDKLIALDKANKATDGRSAPARDMVALRNKLSERIDRLKQS